MEDDDGSRHERHRCEHEDFSRPGLVNLGFASIHHRKPPPSGGLQAGAVYSLFLPYIILSSLPAGYGKVDDGKNDEASTEGYR